MAQIFPAPSRLLGLGPAYPPAIFGYETASGTQALRGILALVQLHELRDGMIVAAQEQSPAPPEIISEELVTLLYDEPAGILDDLVFASVPQALPDGARLFALRDPHAINIVLTELQEKRLILAGNEHLYRAALARRRASSAPDEPELDEPELKVNTAPIHPQGFLHLRPARPEEVVLALLLNEERKHFHIEPLHRIFEVSPAAQTRAIIEQLRLFFHIERLPGTPTAERITYLLSHGNELGHSMVASVAAECYLLKARLEVIAAIFPQEATPLADARLLEYVAPRAFSALNCRAAAMPQALAAIGAPHRAVFFLNPPSLLEIQHAALHRRPLPPDTFRICPTVTLPRAEE